MTKLYYNIIKKPAVSEYPFAIYVSEDESELVRSEENSIWEEVDKTLGKGDNTCEWHRYAINLKAINTKLSNLGCEIMNGLKLDGDKLIRY